ncbi:MAG TPA: GAF domain-containing protein, partial [Planctomycetota bacterium]|nr:GAF domain-containing protein [Planctomycetota bacterium]
MSTGLRAAFDPRHVEDELAGALRSFVARAGADAGLVLLVTGDPDRFMVRAPVGFDAPLIIEIGELARRASFPLTRRAVETGEPVFASSASAGSVNTVYCQAGYDAFAGIPLAVGGAVVGVVHLVSRRATFTLGPLELVEAGRPLGALALSLHGLEAARSAEERGSVVEQVARGVLQHLELASLFPELIRLVARLCPCDAASVAMHRPERDGFELVAVYGPEFRDTVHEGVFVAGRETPMVEAWATGEIIRDPDARTSPYPRARQLA